MENAREGMPLLRAKGAVEVDDEKGGRRVDELSGSSMSGRRRMGAAIGLVVLTFGAISASSALLGGKTSSQGECQ